MPIPPFVPAEGTAPPKPDSRARRADAGEAPRDLTDRTATDAEARLPSPVASPGPVDIGNRRAAAWTSFRIGGEHATTTISFRSAAMTRVDDIVLIGCGAGGPLQLSTEAHRLLERYGFAFSVGVSAQVTHHLGATAVEIERLDELITDHEDPADGLLAAADLIFKQVEIERPVLVLVPGNPLFLNSLSRFIVAEGQRRDIHVRRIAGVSLIDVAINELGIDVSARGIQVFDVDGIVERGNQPALGVPTLLVGFTPSDGEERLGRLRVRLAARVPPEHQVTLVNVGHDGATTRASAPFARFEEFAQHLHGGSCVFLGPVGT